MSRIAVGGEADNLAINGGTTRQRVLQRLQDQRPGAFANHQTVTLTVKRTWRKLRMIVLLTGGKQRVEYRRL
ncbi:hypothetical protein D3C72_2380930 [compost metagenome]